ncbi:MAG: phage Gp37/Gp68 family protein, partial [Planctomycetaceae bacterium]|nr:phage Gp37/Gp68 family protein [Planctomycetaceae bacterium]
MGTNSKIEWTDHTWNPWRGCTKVSPACDNCYMFRESSRYGFNPAEVIRTSIMTFRAPLTFHGTPHVPMQADSRRRREKLHKWADGDKVFVCS